MDNDWEERVRIRAYEIWEREGCPEGGAEQRWLRAEEELLAAEAGVGIDVDDTLETMTERGVEEDPPRKTYRHGHCCHRDGRRSRPRWHEPLISVQL